MDNNSTKLIILALTAPNIVYHVLSKLLFQLVNAINVVMDTTMEPMGAVFNAQINALHANLQTIVKLVFQEII